MKKLKYGFDADRLTYWLSTHENEIFKNNNIYHAQTSRFIYNKVAGAKILAVAHLDTVQSLIGMTISKGGKMIHACGLDDRLGAYIVSDWLAKNGIIASVLLTDQEESGSSTASEFADSDSYNWIVEFDRAGEDVVTYGLDSPTFIKAINKAGFKMAYGSYSDISSLDTNRCCMNVGVGYEKYHAKDSYADLTVLDRQLTRFKKFYKANKDTMFVYEKKTISRYSKYGDYNDDWWNDSMISKRKYFEPMSKQLEPLPATHIGRHPCECCDGFFDRLNKDRFGNMLCNDCYEKFSTSSPIEEPELSCELCGASHNASLTEIGILCDECYESYYSEILMEKTNVA